MPIIIKNAVDNDIEWVVSQLAKFSEFYGTKYKLFGDTEYIKVNLKKMFDEQLFLIAFNGECRVGFISGNIFNHPFNPNIKTIIETFWWVDEAYRNTRAGALLLEAYIKYGKENCQWVIMNLEHKSPVREETLLKRGFKNQERTYLMEI